MDEHADVLLETSAGPVGKFDESHNGKIGGRSSFAERRSSNRFVAMIRRMKIGERSGG